MAIIGTTGLGTSTNPIPLDYNALRTAPDMVIENYIAENLFFRTRNRYPFFSFAEMISRQGSQNYTIDSKKVNWFIGDEEPTTFTLGAAFSYAADTTVTLSADYGSFVIGTLLMIRNVDGAGINHTAIVRVTGSPTLVATLWRYPIEKITSVNDSTLAYEVPAGTYLTTTTSCYVMSHFAPWDGEAGEYIQRRPQSIFNYLQRSRECVGEGKWQMSENFYTDVRIMRQAQDKMYNMLTKLDKQLLLNQFRVGPSGYGTATAITNSLEGAVCAGLPFYLSPSADPTAAMVTAGTAAYAGLRGQIHAIAAAALTYDKLNYFGDKVTAFGSSDLKICVASPANITRVKAALNGITGLRIYTEKFMFPGTNSIWEMDAVQLDSMRLAFLPDHNLDDVPLSVVGTDPETGAAVNNLGAADSHVKWMYFIDPKHIGLAYLNVANEGVSRIRMFDVAAVNRSSVIRKEIEVGMSLVITEPRAHGVLALKTA